MTTGAKHDFQRRVRLLPQHFLYCSIQSMAKVSVSPTIWASLREKYGPLDWFNELSSSRTLMNQVGLSRCPGRSSNLIWPAMATLHRRHGTSVHWLMEFRVWQGQGRSAAALGAAWQTTQLTQWRVNSIRVQQWQLIQIEINHSHYHHGTDWLTQIESELKMAWGIIFKLHHCLIEKFARPVPEYIEIVNSETCHIYLSKITKINKTY